MTADDTAGEPDAAATDPARAAAIDRAVLAKLSELDPDGTNQVVTRLLRVYRRSLATFLEELASADATGDRDAIRRIAHTLKSSSASVGALELARLCRQLEAHPIEGHTSAGTPPSLQALRHESVRIQAELDAILGTRGDEP